MAIHPMWDNYKEIKNDLHEVIKIIEENVTISEKNVQKYVKDMLTSGGKLLRPAYFLMCAKMGPDYDSQEAPSIAAAIELLHIATLIHDDVIDDAKLRRGVPTIKEKFGNNYAIYTGDYLFAVCFKILSKNAKNLSNIEFNTGMMEKILAGELNQLNNKYNQKITIREYLKQISGKTAELFASSCYLGAETSNASQNMKNLVRKIGRNIGMAFQILDDILDYTQDQATIGKPVLTDIRQGIYSLPVIYAIQKNEEQMLAYLSKKEHIREQELEAVLNLILKSGAIESAKLLAKKYTDKSLTLIRKLPEGEYKEQMREITMSLLNRIT